MSKRLQIEDLVGADLVGYTMIRDRDNPGAMKKWSIGGKDKSGKLAQKAGSYGVYTGNKDVNSLTPSDTVYPVLQSFVGDAFMDGGTSRYHIKDGKLYGALSPTTNGEISLAGELLAALPQHFARVISSVDPEKSYNLVSIKENYFHVLRSKLTDKVETELKAASAGTDAVKGSSLQEILKSSTDAILAYIKEIGEKPVLLNKDIDFLKGFAGRWHANTRDLLMRAPYLGSLVKSDTSVFPESGILDVTQIEEPVAPTQTELFDGPKTGLAHKILSTSDGESLLRYVKGHPSAPESFSIVHSYRGEPEAKVLFAAMGGFANHKLLAALSPEDVVAEVGAHESEVQAKPGVLAVLGKDALSMVLTKYPAIKSAMVSIARESGAARTALESIGEL